MKGQVRWVSARAVLEGPMTENAETIIDTEPRTPDGHVSWGRPWIKGSRCRRPPDAQNPSAPVSWCQVLKIDHR